MNMDMIAPAGTATAGADPALFIFKNLHVIGTMVGSMRDTAMALDFAARVSNSSMEILSVSMNYLKRTS
jgi:D-arabinose 1-dehydrogenase-like Zn-dependent alcohol dehydrogenase